MGVKVRLISGILLCLILSCRDAEGEYVCPPCGMQCDELSYSESGNCPHCGMELIIDENPDPYSGLILNEVNLTDGAGVFMVDGGAYPEKSIRVHYHVPRAASKNSRVIMLLPGAGRNGSDYRDAWSEISEKYNVIVISLEYSEKDYPEFWSYNLAGMITDVQINQERTAVTGFSLNEDPAQWLYEDFDRIFALVKEDRELRAERYDVFGHSAGGQILHRLAIFKPASRAHRILAANSGWYTIPEEQYEFPYGLQNAALSSGEMRFDTNLVIFLGAKDDLTETRGEIRHTPEADAQGLHRLARGKFFFEKAKERAEKEGLPFNWKIEIIPGVGHDYKAMSQHAGEYLYAD